MRRLSVAVTLLIVISLTDQSLRAENWPQWRGPKNDGLGGGKNLPVEWDVAAEKNVAWRLPLPGSAGATPVIWGDKIFLTSTDKDDLLLMCVSTAGKELWRKVVGVGDKTARGDEGNSCSPSPSTDGKHVWVMMGTGDLACFDFEGKEVWKLDLQKEYGRFDIQFGMTSSPVIDGDRIFLQLIHSNGAKVIALDKTPAKKFGPSNASATRAECEHSYASPIIHREGDAALLITHGADYVIAYDVKDGREVWRCGGLNPQESYNPTFRLVASPVSSPGLIVVPTAKNGPVLGLRPDGVGDVTGKETSIVWRLSRNTPDVPSPLVHEGLVYLCRENGTLVVLDAKSGEQLYEKRTHADRHRASPILVDGKLYISARDGTVSVVQPGREFKLLGQNKFKEPIAASPIATDGTLYFRTYNALYAVKAK